MVNVATLKERITFENPTKTANPSGGMTESYQPFLTVMASARKLDGYRNLDNGYDGIISVYEFICYGRNRLDTLFTKDTRVIYYDQSYRVENWEVFQDGGYFMRIKASIIK